MLSRVQLVLPFLCICLFAVPSAIAATPAFSDQTAAAGITAVHTPAGQFSFIAGGTVADFNNDGWQDIYFCAGGGAPDSLYINNGDGTFTDQAAAWGIQLTQNGATGTAGDYDGDGRLDLLVTSSGRHRLFRNVSNNTFEDVTESAGISPMDQPEIYTHDGWSGAWGDYDLDGDLDLMIARWRGYNRLFRNEGNGQFTDQSTALPIPPSSISGFAPRFVDLNGDRYPEITLIADFNTGRYLVNETDGTFTDATELSGSMVGSTEMGATIADFDRDGRFDFYVTTVGANNLYMNQGGHQFLQVASDVGVRYTAWGWATASPDIDHDGWQDIIATGQSGQFAFLNKMGTEGELNFEDVSLTLGIRGEDVDSGRGMANFDYDNDGDQDVVVFVFGGPLKLYRNDLTGSGDTHWLRVFLDTSSAPDIAPNGIGSVVKVTTGGFTQTGRIDGGSNYLSQSEMSAHFGLGTATIIDALRVEWTNGDVTILNNVPADQAITIEPINLLLHGDMNCDSVVDINDAALFAIAATDASRYASLVPTCDVTAADMDGNSVIDGRDIAAFVLELLN